MTEIKINIRLPEQYNKQFQRLEKNISQNAIQAITGYLELRKFAKLDLKGVFSANELSYLIDSSNGAMFQTEYAASKEMFKARIEDCSKLEFLDKKWNVDLKQFLLKIDKLTTSQVYFIQLECYNFWYSEIEQPDLEKFIKEWN